MRLPFTQMSGWCCGMDNKRRRRKREREKRERERKKREKKREEDDRNDLVDISMYMMLMDMLLIERKHKYDY